MLCEANLANRQLGVHNGRSIVVRATRSSHWAEFGCMDEKPPCRAEGSHRSARVLGGIGRQESMSPDTCSQQLALLQLHELGLGLLQDGDVGVCVLPESEEFLIRRSSFIDFPDQQVGAAQLKSRQHSQWTIHNRATML